MRGIWALFFYSSFALAFPDVVGRTFPTPGPNCFSTALKVSGFYPTFRGVDTPEFESFIELNCQKVNSPERGDIGIFEKPGFGMLHAYVYVTEGLGLQKPGVDYLGKTPIALSSIESIKYTFEASPECRRYAKDPKECSNLHYYLHCEGPQWGNSGWIKDHNLQVQNVEFVMMELIDKIAFSRDDETQFLELEKRVSDLVLNLETKREFENIQPEVFKYLKARLISLEKQLLFIKTRIQ